MCRVQGTIDSVVEELIVQCRNNLGGFNTFMALPYIIYQISHMLVKPSYHILLIHDLFVCILQHVQIMYNAAS